MFPVLLTERQRAANPLCPSAVPWCLLEAARLAVRDVAGPGSLEDLAAQGGLDPIEIVCAIEARPFPADDAARDPAGTLAAAVTKLIKKLAALEVTTGRAVGVVMAAAWSCPMCGEDNLVAGAVAGGPLPVGVVCRWCRAAFRPEAPGPGPIEWLSPGC